MLNYEDGANTLVKNFGTKVGKYIIIKEYDKIGNLGFSKCAYENIGNKYNIKGLTT